MFHFTDDCITGIEQIDEEHRYLFSLLEEGSALLENACEGDFQEKVNILLSQLENYSNLHFAHEEAYMEQIRDPELPKQRIQHTLFHNKIHDLKFSDIGDEEAQRKVLSELIEFLAKWLYHHIIGSDLIIGKLPPLEPWMIRENPCEFTDDYLTGIELVDSEHRELFHIVEDVYHLVKSGVSVTSYDEIMTVLEKLRGYTIYHFNDEEKYMASIAYEGLAAQKAAHASFIAKIESVDLLNLDEDLQKYMERLIEYLLGWLINHIMYTDKKIPNGIV